MLTGSHHSSSYISAPHIIGPLPPDLASASIRIPVATLHRRKVSPVINSARVTISVTSGIAVVCVVISGLVVWWVAMGV